MALSLSPSGARDARDIPAAVRHAASELGHRPAITLLTPSGRQEQSYTSAAQWAAKTAHWLILDLMLEPEDRLGLVGPPGWAPAVAALGAWWAGLTVVAGASAESADVVVAHADHAPLSSGDVVVWGWGFDGAPTSHASAEAFVHAVQPFPDDPPAPAGAPDSPALDDGTTMRTQVGLLDALRDATAQAFGVDAAATSHWVTTAALRPLVTGRPTLLLAPGVERAAAAGDRVTAWLD